MVDAQVEILITAVDKMTATFKKIEGTITSGSKNIQNQTKKSSDAFSEQMTTLVGLGNVANSVNNIFDSYENLQLRLENATDRVMNAQDRLAKAQRNLLKVQKDVNATTEDLADAQQEVITATRGLEISQNNLERANNQVINTYINMGIQSVSAIASLYKMRGAIGALIVESWAFIATPLGATLLVISAVVGQVGYAFYKTSDEIKKQNKLVETISAEYDEKYNNAARETIKLEEMKAKTIQRTSDNIHKQFLALQELIRGPLEGENQANLEIAKQQQIVDELRLEGLKATSDMEKENIQVKLDEEQNKLDILNAQYQVDYSNYKNIQEAEAKVTEEKQNEKIGIYATTFKQINDAQQEFKNASIKAAQEIATENINQANATKTAWDAAYDAMRRLGEAKKTAAYLEETKFERTLASYVAGGIGIMGGTLYNEKPSVVTTGGGGTAFNFTNPLNIQTPFSDFISRPGQAPVSFSSDDTIVGTKSGGLGTKIIITGNIYGVDADDISEALYQRIANKISQ